MGIQLLANAIIEQTAIDYINMLKRLKRYPKSKKLMTEIDELERFFRSNWFKVLTQIDPEYLIARLRKETEK